MKPPTYPRALETRRMTLDEARALVGTVNADGRWLTAEEIQALDNVEIITRARDVMTGEMKAPRSKSTFVLVKA